MTTITPSTEQSLRAHQSRMLEDAIERERQAMLDCYEAGNCQQARYHKEQMDKLILQRSKSNG